MPSIKDIHDAVAAGNYKEIGSLVSSAIDSGESLEDIINNALSSAMIEVGDKFGSGELYMPDMLLAKMLSMSRSCVRIKSIASSKIACRSARTSSADTAPASSGCFCGKPDMSSSI